MANRDWDLPAKYVALFSGKGGNDERAACLIDRTKVNRKLMDGGPKIQLIAVAADRWQKGRWLSLKFYIKLVPQTRTWQP